MSPDMTPPLGKVSQPSGHDLASRAPHTLAETGIHLGTHPGVSFLPTGF